MTPGDRIELVSCTPEAHAAAILDILNEAIAHSTALFDYQPRSAASMNDWFAAKTRNAFPVIGAVTADGHLAGFASYGTFRAWPAYKYSVEHSVYVHAAHRGRGIGLALMRRLIAEAGRQQYHALVGVIEAANTPSIALHEKLGFVHAGTIREAGYKFGRWLDVAFYQLLLDTPDAPADG